MTLITSNRNFQVISIKPTVSAFFVYILMKSRVYMYCPYVTEFFFSLGERWAECSGSRAHTDQFPRERNGPV